MIQPWPFFFLATFLAAFFFFFAIDLAPCHEHPARNSHPLPRVLSGGEWTTFRHACDRDFSLPPPHR
jgi:hypothetical protein